MKVLFCRFGEDKIPLASLLILVIGVGGVGGMAYGQVPPPITSSGLNTQVSAPVNGSGGAVQHNITGGTRPGGGPNLFHSFGEFGVPTNNIANFLNDAALPTANILSRVTGGNPSNILGTIQDGRFRQCQSVPHESGRDRVWPECLLECGWCYPFHDGRLFATQRWGAVHRASGCAGYAVECGAGCGVWVS